MPIVREAAQIGLYGWEFMLNAMTDPTGLTLPVAVEELFWGDAGIGLSIMGTGLGAPGAKVRWRVAGRMGLAWLITLPSAGAVAAALYGLDILLGGVLGPPAIILVMGALGLWMFLHSRRDAVGSHNVNDEWEPTPTDKPKVRA